MAQVREGDGADGIRTRDLLAASQTLSQLSYGPKGRQSSRELEIGGVVDACSLVVPRGRLGDRSLLIRRHLRQR